MSKLHDMIKSGSEKIQRKAAEKVNRAIDKTMAGLVKKLSKEDPEKVTGFLTDLANDATLSPEVRGAFLKLLAAHKEGNILDAMKEQTTNQMRDMLK